MSGPFFIHRCRVLINVKFDCVKHDLARGQIAASQKISTLQILSAQVFNRT